MAEHLQCTDKSAPSGAQTVTFPKIEAIDDVKGRQIACDQMMLTYHGERAVGAAQYISMAEVVLCLIGAAALTGWGRIVATGLALAGAAFGLITFFSEASAMLP
jgi:hypothetical protein